MADFKNSLMKAVSAAAETRQSRTPEGNPTWGTRVSINLARLWRFFLILNREVKKQKISWNQAERLAQQILKEDPDGE